MAGRHVHMPRAHTLDEKLLWIRAWHQRRHFEFQWAFLTIEAADFNTKPNCEEGIIHSNHACWSCGTSFLNLHLVNTWEFICLNQQPRIQKKGGKKKQGHLSHVRYLEIWPTEASTVVWKSESSFEISKPEAWKSSTFWKLLLKLNESLWWTNWVLKDQCVRKHAKKGEKALLRKFNFHMEIWRRIEGTSGILAQGTTAIYCPKNSRKLHFHKRVTQHLFSFPFPYKT